MCVMLNNYKIVTIFLKSHGILSSQPCNHIHRKQLKNSKPYITCRDLQFD